MKLSKIHDLVALLDLVLAVEPAWEEFRVDLAFLSDFAVDLRYPGEFADRESAMDARRCCRVFPSCRPCDVRLGAMKSLADDLRTIGRENFPYFLNDSHAYGRVQDR